MFQTEISTQSICVKNILEEYSNVYIFEYGNGLKRFGVKMCSLKGVNVVCYEKELKGIQKP